MNVYRHNPVSIFLQFAEWCLDYGTHGCRIPDRPYSLFEGTKHLLFNFSLDWRKKKKTTTLTFSFPSQNDVIAGLQFVLWKGQLYSSLCNCVCVCRVKVAFHLAVMKELRARLAAQQSRKAPLRRNEHWLHRSRRSNHSSNSDREHQ